MADAPYSNESQRPHYGLYRTNSMNFIMIECSDGENLPTAQAQKR